MEAALAFTQPARPTFPLRMIRARNPTTASPSQTRGECLQPSAEANKGTDPPCDLIRLVAAYRRRGEACQRQGG